MKKLDLDFRFLSDAFIALVVCVVVSAAMMWYSHYFKTKEEAAYQRNHAQFKDTSQRYLAVDDEDRIIREQYPRFIDLYNRGVIGEENRLNWLETLRRAGASIKLPELRYQINAQEAANPPYLVGTNTGHFQVYESRMRLDLGLLHEYDFATLLDELNRHAAGLYSISRCTFTRKQGAIEPNPKAQNISAGCELEWYTVNLPDKSLVLR
ncbi:MAG: hypothetical protein ACT4NU_07090 [Chromatiales bacterium]